jgi:hypothetical protein
VAKGNPAAASTATRLVTGPIPLVDRSRNRSERRRQRCERITISVVNNAHVEGPEYGSKVGARYVTSDQVLNQVPHGWELAYNYDPRTVGPPYAHITRDC